MIQVGIVDGTDYTGVDIQAHFDLATSLFEHSGATATVDEHGIAMATY